MSGKLIKENKCLEEFVLDIESLKAEIKRETLELAYPIGKEYVTQENINPAIILGFGIWERVKGKVLVGLNESIEAFNTIGKEGGEIAHTLTQAEIPSHTHGSKDLAGSIYLSGAIPVGNTADNKMIGGGGICSASMESTSSHPIADITGQSGQKSNLVVINATHEHSPVGGNQAHNNIQPYKVVGYMWIRTA